MRASTRQPVKDYVAPPPKPAAGGKTDPPISMEATKSFAARLGADKVKRIVDLLG